MNESELLTSVYKSCCIAETLAYNNIQTIQVPICGNLIELSSAECINLIKYELYNWKNETANDKIYLYYFITDYISCGLGSPSYYTEFHKTLQSDKSKTKLLKDLLTVWDYVFKHYSITCTNIKFIKRIVISLERLFVIISNLIPDNHNHLQCNNVLNRIRRSIETYELYVLKYCAPHTSIIHSKLERNIDIENRVSKKSNDLEGCHSHTNLVEQIISLSNQKLQNMENIEKLNLNQKTNRNLKTDFGNKVCLPFEPKINAFQIMMLNAKKLGTKVK